MIFEKPRLGEPCNGCGMCCRMVPCELAREMLGAPIGKPCPALESEDGRYWCGLVRDPVRWLGIPEWGKEYTADMIATALGVGRGCDSG